MTHFKLLPKVEFLLLKVLVKTIFETKVEILVKTNFKTSII